MKTKKMIVLVFLFGSLILTNSFTLPSTNQRYSLNQYAGRMNLSKIQLLSTSLRITGDITVYAHSTIMGGYGGTATSSFSYPPDGIYTAPQTVIDADGFTITLHIVSHTYDSFTKTYTDKWEGSAVDPSNEIAYSVSATIIGNYGDWNFNGSPLVQGAV